MFEQTSHPTNGSYQDLFIKPQEPIAISNIIFVVESFLYSVISILKYVTVCCVYYKCVLFHPHAETYRVAVAVHVLLVMKLPRKRVNTK